MKVAYFDCFSGVSGDMFVGALLDAGCDAKALLRGLKKLPVRGYRIEIRKEKRGGFAGTRFDVQVQGQREHEHHSGHQHSHDHGHSHGHDHDHHDHHHAHEHPHRTLKEVHLILKKAKLPKSVFDRAISAFDAIAQAESKAHGISPQKVHFHEVGAVDAIVDIVAAAYALELMGIEQIYSSALPMGSGFVHCDHGKVPVPVPGTIGMMKKVPVRLGSSSGPTGELVTPTGAALLTAWATSIGEQVDLLPNAIGYGAGKRDRQDVANLLRVILGEKKSAALQSDQVYLLEANIDDMPGEMLAYAAECLLTAGALDAYFTPIQMKKNRPGVILSAIVEPAKRVRVEDVFFRETTTLGVRRQLMERTKLRRETKILQTAYGKLACKVSYGLEGKKRISPEFDSLREMAKRTGKSMPFLVCEMERLLK